MGEDFIGWGVLRGDGRLAINDLGAPWLSIQRSDAVKFAAGLRPHLRDSCTVVALSGRLFMYGSMAALKRDAPLIGESAASP